MAYETGVVNNSHELIHKLKGFLANIGWQPISILKTDANDSDGYDIVFYSPSEGGDRGVYIRLAAGLSDTSTLGDIQHPYSDGYNEFINGLAYVYFPNGGSATDGLSELGKYGPLLYNFPGTGVTNAYFEEYNMWPNVSDSPRKDLVADDGSSFNPGSARFNVSSFDGKRFVWQSETNAIMMRCNLFDNTLSSRSVSGLTSTMGSPTVYAKTDGGTEYLINLADSLTNKMNRYTISSNAWTSVGAGLKAPPFTSGSFVGTACTGVKRRRGELISTRVYFARGGASSEWALYDVDRNVWTSLLSPSLPFTISLSTTVNGASVYVPKEASGYEYDRIYFFRGANTTNFASVPIREDGYTAGPFFTHASTPVVQTTGTTAFLAGRAIFFLPGGTTDDRSLYRFTLPTGDGAQSGSWDTISTGWLDSTIGVAGGMLFETHQHYCNRASVTEFSTNTYWAFADLDRVVVVVKNASGQYNYIYAGLFTPYFSEFTTTLTNAVNADSDTLVVGDPSLFRAGNIYSIVDQSGTQVSYTSLTSETRKFAPSENFTVQSISGNTLTITRLQYSYAAGSIIGEEPMPLMVRAHSIEKAQTINNINLRDNLGFLDPAWQVYRMIPTTDTTFTQAADLEDRTINTYLVPIVLLQDGISNEVGKEVRGQLKDVYACGTAVASETEINIGSQTYIAFDIAESGETRRIVVGPI